MDINVVCNVVDAIEKVSKEDFMGETLTETEDGQIVTIVSFDSASQSIEISTSEPRPSEPLNLEDFILQLIEKNNGECSCGFED